MNIDSQKLNAMLSVNEVNKDIGFKPTMKRIELTDGESLSVQSGECLYCSPRDNYGPWRKVEVGYPSVSPSDAWKEYFEGNWETDDHTSSVYGYVPIELVVSFINDHGGIKE